MDVDGLLRTALQSDSYQKPAQDEKIFKDECAYCFKTPFWKGKSLIFSATLISQKDSVECHKCKDMLTMAEVEKQIEKKKNGDFDTRRGSTSRKRIHSTSENENEDVDEQEDEE
uniref:Zf-UBP_var domain-containing protein n=1 Tax=Caenorhabditis japonica TaxID=281687 RepID=A0A8R1ITM7_CAEJA